MKTCLLIQSPTGIRQESLQASVAACIARGKFDTSRVAVAYATVSGVRALLAAFDQFGLRKSEWLLGLDDSFTQPGAIELLLSLKHSTVRLASFEMSGRRFHCKFYAFARAGKPRLPSAMIGSANLTASALHGNSESAVLLHCTRKQDKDELNARWNLLWAQGNAPNAEALSTYSKMYERRRRLYRKVHKLATPKEGNETPQSVLVNDDAEIDPSMAGTCWIECGNVTAMGRELEFKAEQGLFFGLDPSGGNPRVIRFQLSDGSSSDLRMKYQGNQMWRLQMNNNVPEVKVGLRPEGQDGKLGRSPYVAVFGRIPGTHTIKLRFLDLSSKEFRVLRKRTIRSGTLGRTTTREYGWCA